MENFENKIIDANGNEITLTEDDFKFIQQDKKIKDKNFDTKPTTFFKDAMNRFKKNRSSVIASIIIGLLILLSIFVPIISPYNNYSGNVYISKMTPRLLSNGTWWAGYRQYNDQPYNLLNDTYGEFNKEYITNATFDYTKSDNSNSANLGGIYVIYSSSKKDDSQFTFRNGVTIPANSDLVMSLEVTNDQALLSSVDKVFTSYSVDLYDTNNNLIVNLLEKTSNTGVNTINIGEKVTTQVENAVIKITLSYSDSDKFSCLPIQSMTFTTSDTTLSDSLNQYTITKDSYALDENVFNSDGKLTEEEEKAYLSTLKDHSAVVQANASNNIYRLSRCKSCIYGAISATTSFKYNEYESKLGLNSEKTLSKSEVESYVRNGWCEFAYDSATGDYTFKLLSDSCPLKSVSKVKTVSSSYAVTGEVLMYQYYGYSSMPRFLFGTDAQGRDLFTYAFFALRTSLIIAFVITAINFIVGVIYGSIEGYFGGNVDLFMERLSDILGYLPTTILITLLFLNYGKSLFIFGLGMTLTGWLGVAGRTRTQFYRFKGREYVLASRTLGASDARLIFKHVLPNSLGTLITTSVLMVPGTISTEATLSYIGLGLEGTASFGVVMSDNQQELLSNPNLVLFPAVIMSLLMITFNLFGNGLRDAFNPSLKGSE